jgi:putative ABC transport system ATP-binding protein
VQPTEPLVSARGICRRFRAPGHDVDALVDVSFEAAGGTLTTFAGPSGSGKSTLLMTVAAADRPDAGDVIVAGASLVGLDRRARRRWRRTRVGIVLAQPSANLTVGADAAGNLRWAASLRHRALEPDRAATESMLDAVGLAGRGAARVAELSGGEQMRLAVACAIVGDPEIVVMDEPTASLDRDNAGMLVDLLGRLSDSGTTLVVATHDARVVERSSQIVRLDHGRRIA